MCLFGIMFSSVQSGGLSQVTNLLLHLPLYSACFFLYLFFGGEGRGGSVYLHFKMLCTLIQ